MQTSATYRCVDDDVRSRRIECTNHGTPGSREFLDESFFLAFTILWAAPDPLKLVRKKLVRHFRHGTRGQRFRHAGNGLRSDCFPLGNGQRIASGSERRREHEEEVVGAALHVGGVKGLQVIFLLVNFRVLETRQQQSRSTGDRRSTTGSWGANSMSFFK